MTIGPDLKAVARVNAAFAEYADAQGVPVAVRRSMNVALDELLTNTVTYGASREITIEGELGADRLSLTLTDNGSAFDPFSKAAPDTAASVEDRKIGGLGVHLVRTMMDESSYQRRSGFNVVTVSKNLKGH